jgi:hypothetical protein
MKLVGNFLGEEKMSIFQGFVVFLFWALVIFWILSEKVSEVKRKHFKKCLGCGANKVTVHTVYTGRDSSHSEIKHYCHHSVCRKCGWEERKDECQTACSPPPSPPSLFSLGIDK